VVNADLLPLPRQPDQLADDRQGKCRQNGEFGGHRVDPRDPRSERL